MRLIYFSFIVLYLLASITTSVPSIDNNTCVISHPIILDTSVMQHVGSVFLVFLNDSIPSTHYGEWYPPIWLYENDSLEINVSFTA